MSTMAQLSCWIKMESLIVATKDYDKENKKGDTSLSMKHFHECEIQ